jgi:DNA helicase-2/ATP-dependent DNA helicase PcrA
MRGCDGILSGLNPAQREAVLHGGGPLLILAGPGSGKTRVLTHRVARLISSGMAAPGEILAVTFTNKAAEEMRSRLAALLGPDAARTVRASTFHSACAHVLRHDYGRIGGDPGFTVADEDARKELLEQVAEKAGLDRQEAFAAGRAISFAKNCLVGPDSFSGWAADRADGSGLIAFRKSEVLQGIAREAAEAYRLYQRLLRAAGMLDFEDLLFEAVRLFRERPDVLAKWQERWKWVLVDEYQDTNRAQYEWLRLLTARRRNVTVVGDPDQSIYGWRAADVENVRRFLEDHPDARVVPLGANYRCAREVVAASARLISRSAGWHKKGLSAVRVEAGTVRALALADEREEAGYAAGQIERLRRLNGLPWREFAVLVRRNAATRQFEEEFARRAIPYVVVGGPGFWGRAEVKDVLAHLRVAVNPRDALSLRRAARLQPGVGKVLSERLALMCLEGVPAGEALERLAAEPGVSARAAGSLRRLAGVLAELEEGARRGVSAAELCRLAAERSGYLGRLRRAGSEEARERLANVEALASAAAELDAQGGGVRELLERAALASGEGAEDEGRDAVRLLTLHKAKGLEFAVVFMPGMEEGGFPDFRSAFGPALEEERRVCYVGMTRAKDALFLTWCRRRLLWGRAQAREPSRFLAEAGLFPDGAGLGFREGAGERGAAGCGAT